MYIYYKYALDGSRLVLLYYVDDCVYWYTSKELGKWFLDTLRKIFHMKFLEYSQVFMSVSMSQRKYHSILVD